MDPRIAGLPFQPPPPMSMDAYLDDIIGKKLGNLEFASVFDVDKALEAISRRPSFTEQAALIAALEQRFIAYGRQRRWLDEAQKTPDQQADQITKFIVEDLLGWKKKSPDQKATDALTKMLKDWVKGCLNSRGKKYFEFLDTLWELSKAKTAGEAGAILAKLPIPGIKEWVGQHWFRMWGVGEAMGLSGKVSRRLVKVIAAQLTWASATLARWSPWITAIDLMLTPEAVATDEEEARLSFLTVYGRVVAGQNNLAKIVMSAGKGDWRFQVDPGDALRTHVQRLEQR